MKTRPPKKNPKLLAKLLEYIYFGRTITDACRGCGISTTTFNRWRNEDLDFNKEVILATQRQWEMINETKRSGRRTYKRDARISPDYDENRLKTRQNDAQDALNSEKPLMIDGLPVRYGDIYDDKPYTPCVSPDGLFVSFIEVRGSIAYHRHYCLSEWQAMQQN